MRLTLRHALAAVITCTLNACSGNEADPASPGPGIEQKLHVSLSAHVDTIPESTSKTFTARVTDQTGFLKSVPVTWSSSDPNVASVASGNVTGVTPGTAWVVASVTGARDSVHVVVTTNDLTLDIQPSAAAVAMGDTVDFVATLRTRSGDILAVNTFAWNSSDTAAAQFVGGGSLKTKREGELLISATAMARRGEGTVRIFKSPVASVTISPSTASVYKGATVTLTATPRDQNGRHVEGDVAWGSSDHTKATVNGDGVVTGIGAGSVVITATSEARTASAIVTVLGAPATTVQVSLPSNELLVGTEMQATATLLDASGEQVTGRTVAWQSANPSIATVNSTGTVKGVNEGDVNVSAIVDGVIATQRLSVKGRKAASISVVPAAPNVSVGHTAQLVAKVLDQNGVEISNAPVSWSSAKPSTASVTAGGLMSGVSAGTTTITAITGQLSATATATVGSVPVASVRVTPSSSSLAIGGQVALVAQAFDLNQNVLSGRAVSWTSQAPSIATVNSSGVVTAVSGGSATITADVEGKSASATITVAAGPQANVAVVTVTLSNSALNIGEQSQGTAVLTDANGKVLTGREVDWSSLDNAVATVSSNGLVTATGPGTVVIMARSEGVSGAASVNVNTPTLAKVARVRVDAPTQDIDVGEQVQTVVTLFDESGNVLTGRTIAYTTQDAQVVTVSANGVVKGAGAGYTRIVATSGGVSGTEGFTVASSVNPVSTISISPASATLSVGQTTQATATANGSEGASLSSSYTWTTSNAGVATVSSNGLVNAVGAGTATVTASSSGVTGGMSVTVTAGPQPSGTVSSVTVSLSPSSITVGGAAQAIAIAKDANGAIISGKTATWSLGVSLLANISSSGVVTGLLAGIVPVKATVDGVVGTSNLTISSLLAPPPASAIVELPRTYLNFSFPSRTGQTIIVPAGGNLQNALNSAQRGDEIVLPAGAKFTGNFTLPAKSGSGWIVIRSDKHSQLPSQGTRVTPAQASLMPIIETPNVSPAIKTAASASGWWLVGLNVTVTGSLTAQQYGLVNLGDNAQTTMASVPSDLVLDRMYVHGQTSTNMSRCVSLNSARTQVSDSYLSECHGRDFDSQAIWGGNWPGPFKIVNNTLIGAGENIMFGGSDPKIPGLVPSDIEIRRNYVYTPLSWKGVWQRKNLLEFKNASRVLIEGNVFEGSWADAQTGWAIIFKSANQGGNCLWCRTTDVTFRKNLVTNAGAGINVAPKGSQPSDTTARRILISENVLENIGVGSYTGDRRGFQLLANTYNVTIERSVLNGNLTAALFLEGTYAPVFRDNAWTRGQYGVIATGAGSGIPALDKGAPGWSWNNMAMIGSTQSGYPTGTSWFSNESSVPLAAQVRSIVSQATAGVIIP